MTKSGKRDHAARIAANLAVVREAFARAEAAKAPRSEVARTSLAVVEAWLRGETVGADELSAANKAAHEDGGRWWNDTTPMCGAASWSCTAAGNLCWMAKKTRGWEDGDRSIMDAAVYTVTSTISIKDRRAEIRAGARVREELEAVRDAALTAALASAPQAKAPTQPRLRAIPDLAKRVGDVAAAYMKRKRARIDPAQRGDASSLRTVLAERGYTAHAAVVAFDERWGGMIMARDREGDDWLFGAFGCSTDGSRGGKGHSRRRLVPVAQSPNDVIYFLDAEGAAWGHDTIEEASASPVAGSGDQLVATIVLFEMVFEERMRKRLVEADGLHGKRVARTLKLPAIRHATDRHVAFWGDGKTLVAEVREKKGRTIVCGAAWKRAVLGPKS